MILGIDPGLTGALALYDAQDNRIFTTSNIPTLSLKRNGKIKSSLNFHALAQIVKGWAESSRDLKAVLELVGAMPGQGVSSMFSFGKVVGAVEMAIVSAGIPYTYVTPAVWKKALGCTADKDATLFRASQLMPASVKEWTPVRGVRNKEECKGIAEAALIAYYGAKILP